MASFDIPLDLPHAARVAARIAYYIDRRYDASDRKYQALFVIISKLLEVLVPFHQLDENPPPDEAEAIRQQAASFGRRLVTEIELADAGDDRLGQCVRNLFECLEMGEEGARLSLRAGENPDSLQRPW